MNILGWTIMVALGVNAAIRLVTETHLHQAIFLFLVSFKKTEKLKTEIFCSVRVSNELGAAHPRTAKFSLVVAVVTSFFIGLFLSAILIATRNEYPSLFSSDTSVETLVKELTPILAFCIVINNVQPVLSGKKLRVSS